MDRGTIFCMFAARLIIRKALKSLAESSHAVPLVVQFSDGSRYQPISGNIEITFVFRSRSAEWRTLIFNYVGFFESYRDGSIDILGDDALRKLVKMVYGVPKRGLGFNPVIALLTFVQEWCLSNRNPVVELDNLMRHYNLPAEFFHFMDGELYGYTEGYYESGSESQNKAQMKKIRLHLS